MIDKDLNFGAQGGRLPRSEFVCALWAAQIKENSRERYSPTRYKWVGTRPIRPDGVPKVTGRAMYGADFATAGHALRQDPPLAARPCPHPLDRHLEGGGAARRQGGRSPAADFPDHKFEYIGPERVAVNFWHVTRNVMAREKALYEGHAVAAVAAITQVDRRGGRGADRDRLRGAAARHRCRRGDEAETRRCCSRT